METTEKTLRWATCPHCRKSLNEHGLNYECAHFLEITEFGGDPCVKASRDLCDGTYYCGWCGHEIAPEHVRAIDMADWQ